MGLVDLNSTCSLIWHESKATSMDCSDDDQKSLPKMWVPNVSWRHRSGIFFREAAESNVMMSCYAMLIGNRPCNQWPGWSKRTSRWSTETAMRFQSPRVLREPSLLHPSTASFTKIVEHSMMWKTFTIYFVWKSEIKASRFNQQSFWKSTHFRSTSQAFDTPGGPDRGRHGHCRYQGCWSGSGKRFGSWTRESWSGGLVWSCRFEGWKSRIMAWWKSQQWKRMIMVKIMQLTWLQTGYMSEDTIIITIMV